MRIRLPIALTALLTAPALADTPPVLPRLEYRPVLADYVPDREIALADWRAVNATVERLGGHMGHARLPSVGPGGRDASDRPSTSAQERARP